MLNLTLDIPKGHLPASLVLQPLLPRRRRPLLPRVEDGAGGGAVGGRRRGGPRELRAHLLLQGEGGAEAPPGGQVLVRLRLPPLPAGLAPPQST